MAYSGSQGNDVPDVWARGKDGTVDRLQAISPSTKLPSQLPNKERGKRTTPQVAIIR
ncbi:hypothetical protein BH09PAT2_BH09PAT2_03950 [soil metagenome]